MILVFILNILKLNQNHQIKMMKKWKSQRVAGGSDTVERNNLVFGILLLLTQLTICLVYGFLARVTPCSPSSQSYGSLLPILHAFLLFLLILGKCNLIQVLP